MPEITVGSFDIRKVGDVIQGLRGPDGREYRSVAARVVGEGTADDWFRSMRDAGVSERDIEGERQALSAWTAAGYPSHFYRVLVD